MVSTRLYCIIQDGEVHYIFEAESLPEISSDIQIIDITSNREVQEGFKYVNGVFYSRAEIKTLDEAKEERKTYIKSCSEIALESGFTCSLNIKVNCNIVDSNMLEGGIRLAKLNNLTSLEKFRDFNNDIHPNMSITDAEKILLEVVSYQAYVFNKKWMLQESIDNCTSVQDVLNIDW